MVAVRLRAVDKTYPNGFEAIRGLSLSVEDGEFHVLLGPSGCGKSTVLRMIAGLEEVTGGDIELDGERINDLPSRDRDMAMAFQGHAIYPHMSVAENLGFPLKLSGSHADEIDRRVRATAQLLHLDAMLEHRPRQLSGGQQQRVSLGRSIIRSPRVFLMDEPLSNLDSGLRIEARAEITRIQRSLGTTTIFVTHDQIEAMALADRVTIMRDGRIVQSGSPADVYADPVDLFVAQFMGSPPMNVVVGTIVHSTENDGPAVEVASQIIPLGRDAVSTPAGRLVEGTEVGVGIRPEAMRPDDHGQLTVSPEYTELLGSSQLVHASITAPRVTDISGTVQVGRSHRSMVTAFAPAQAVVGRFAPFILRVDPESIHLFDLETGSALAARGRSRAQPFARPV